MPHDATAPTARRRAEMSDDYKTWYEKTKRRNTINAILVAIVVCIGFYILITAGAP